MFLRKPQPAGWQFDERDHPGPRPSRNRVPAYTYDFRDVL